MATLTFVLIVGGAGVSLAKGAESGTLAGPNIDRPISLIDSGKSFDTYESDAPIRLIRQTGLWTGSRPALTNPQGDLGEQYILTWVNMGPPGDPVEERTIYQYLYPNAAGGSLIHTPEQLGLEDWGVEVIGWFEGPTDLADTIHEVIAWSTTEEGKPLQSVETPTATNPQPLPAAGETASAQAQFDFSLAPLSLTLIAAVLFATLFVWRMYQSTHRPD